MVYQVNDDAAGIRCSKADMTSIAIPAKTVQLLKWASNGPIGKASGVVSQEVSANDCLELWINSTKERGEDPVYEWFLLAYAMNGTDSPLYVVSDQGMYDVRTIDSDLDHYTFSFDSLGLTKIGTFRMADLGQYSGDLLLYGYAYQNLSGTILVDNIVHLNIR